MKNSSIFNWILNHLTYFQTYVLICLFFFLSILPLEYYWVRNHLQFAHLLDLQIQWIEQEHNARQLFMHIQKHQISMHRYLKNHNISKTEIEKLQAHINRLLRQFPDDKQIELARPALPASNPSLNLQQFTAKWQSLLQSSWNLPPEISDQLHSDLIHELQSQLNYSGNQFYLYANRLGDIVMTENILLRLPFLQENLNTLILAIEDYLYILEQMNEGDKTAISNLILKIQSDLNYIRKGQNVPNDKSSLHISLIQTLTDYVNFTDDLLQFIQTNFIYSRPSISHLNELNDQYETQTTLASNLWEQELNDLAELFTINRNYFYKEMWGVLLLSLLGMALTFAFGLMVTHNATSRLKQLADATNSFTNGDLSVRVPIPYDDEVGKMGGAFNQMAQRLEAMINLLYELLEAIHRLAEGDLSVRLKAKNGDPEFKSIRESFNNMAENFENIINRLQQLGITLTTSATQISTASKEQEIIIVEQEATTREIAVAANEISSTAKEFANTMNEVSQTAEQTSNLAVAGKSSLTNMESIMRQMVDASTNIASKLAILNEKAGNITSVITTITKVADQTNLLSLNASIEAEKAGEYGKSFAVIAREIRRLADQTAIATFDIEKIVNEIMSAVSSSVMGVDDFTQEIRIGVEHVRKVSEHLSKIIEQVQVFTGRFELVNQGMQAQSTGAEQINESITQLSQTAQQTTESIHQFHKTIQELNAAAHALRALTPFIQPHSINAPSSDTTLREPPSPLAPPPTPAHKLSDIHFYLHSDKKDPQK